MKTAFAAVGFLVFAHLSALAQYAPATLNYAVAYLTVTSGTLPFASYGTTSAGFILGNTFSYNTTGDIASAALGTYFYSQTGPNTGLIQTTRTNITPAFTAPTYLTFTSASGGTWTSNATYDGYTGSAQGTFTFTLLQPVSAGTTTTPTAGTGIALVEVYEVTAENQSTHRLANISTKGFVGTGQQALTGGFVVSGSNPETVLIRAIGPTLSNYQVSGVLTSPVLTLYDSSDNVIAANAGWANAATKGNSSVKATIQAATSTLMASIGASTILTGSADSALVAILPPGSYTVIVTGQ